MNQSLEQLRTFHLTGKGGGRGGMRLRPQAVDAPARRDAAARDYPVYLSSEPSLGTLRAMLAECVAKEPNSFPSLVQSVDRVALAFGSAATAGSGTPIATANATALASLAAEVPEEEIARLRVLLPKQGTLFPCDAAALPVIYGRLLAGARQWARAQWLARLQSARVQLSGLLGAGGDSTLGVEGDLLFDAAAMARAIEHRKGPRRMEGARRTRIEEAVAAIASAIEAEAKAPSAWVFHSGAKPAGAGDLGWELRQSEDSFAAACWFAQDTLERTEAAWRAVRLARIEAESSFDETLHGERLARFTWHAATPDELRALPPVVVVENAECVADASLTGFGRLLRSGLPVQVLIESAGIDPLRPDIGDLAMAHREAFVLSASLARVDHLAAGLAAMNASVRPAVAVVAVPGEGEGWLEAATAVAAGVHPLYRYDPDQGDSWRDRFSLVAPDEGGALNAADAAAMSAPLANHFFAIAPEFESRELMEMDQYLAAYATEPPLSVPYLRVLDHDGKAARVAVSRELAMYARNRRVAMRSLGELAGIGNAHVAEAVAAARDEERKAAQSREAAAREEAARASASATVRRLVGALMGAEPAALFAPPPVTPAPATIPQPAAQTPVPAPAEPAATAGPAAGAYVESDLCTSCHDCVKINERMFRYNANQQVYLADASAGSYAELVKAAEKCPARCIHPGAPRPGDASATAAIVARGAKFG
ncbi:MAG: ferredoxin [Bryobacteraceae bacterium]